MTMPSMKRSICTIVPLVVSLSAVAAFAPFGVSPSAQTTTTTSSQMKAHESFSFPFDSPSDGQNDRKGGEPKKYPLQQEHSESRSDDNPGVLSSADYFALEAFSLGTINASIERYERLFQESETKKRFVFGNDLLELRKKVTELRAKLSKAQHRGRDTDVGSLRSKIRRLSLQDAEFVYGEMLDLADQAKKMGSKKDAKLYKEEASAVRACLPHFNVEGLWVGKYGDHGYEMINVTYVGDTLIATKVTGDKNVPKDEVTFTADLSPSFHRGAESALPPIELSSTASKQWGTKGLMRYPGKGQVAAEGYQNAKYMDGQLIMVGEDYFSFAWVPIGYQIFFGRPSAELTLKMLKQSEESIVAKGREAFLAGDVETMRKYATRCLEATDESSWLVDAHVEIMDGEEELHFQ